MITFADLMALLLAFFVLIFSMSDFESNRWREVVSSLSTDLAPMALSNVPDKTDSTGVFQDPGDLQNARSGYLLSLISTRFDSQIQSGVLAVGTSANSVLLSIETKAIADPLEEKDEESWLTELAAFFGTLREPISIFVAYSTEDADDEISSVSESLRVGEAVHQALKRSGYPRAMAVFASSSTAGGEKGRVRLQIETGRR